MIRPQLRAKLHIFSLRMREMAIFLLPVNNPTSPSCSPTPISYKMQKFRRFGHKYGPNCIFLLRMRKTALFLLPVKNLTSPSCSPTPISYMMQELWRLGHKYVPNCIFFIAHARNGHISTSGQTSDVTIIFPEPDLL